jgi:hypothetical protein
LTISPKLPTAVSFAKIALINPNASIVVFIQIKIKKGPPNNMWVKKYLKRRGCGESFLRHKGRSEYSPLQLNSNTILSIKIILMAGKLYH